MLVNRGAKHLYDRCRDAALVDPRDAMTNGQGFKGRGSNSDPNPTLYTASESWYTDFDFSNLQPVWNNTCALCTAVGNLSCRCKEPLHLPQETATTIPEATRQSHEASTLFPQQHEMEVDTQPNGTVAQISPGEAFDLDAIRPTAEMTVTGDTIFPLTDLHPPNEPQDIPAYWHESVRDISALSRDAVQDEVAIADVNETQEAANILTNGIHRPASPPQHHHALIAEAAQNKIQDIRGEMELELDHIRARWGHRIDHGGGAEDSLDPQTQEQVTFPAFAKLVFKDGDYFVRSHTILIGRNMDFYRDWKRQNKERREANKDLLSYRKEPSQPSHGGDHDQLAQGSSSNQSLEGRPAPASTASEQGGAVYYSNRDHETSGWRWSRRKRSSMAHSKSSSTHSINPWNLHPQAPDANMDTVDLDENGEPFHRTFGWLPVHPQKKDDIAHISRQHMLVRYNFQQTQWELVALANGVYVDQKLVPKGKSVPLDHNSWIRILSLAFHFKLPDHFAESDGISRGTWGSDIEGEVDDYLSDDEEEEGESVGPDGKLTGAFAQEDDLDVAAQELEDEEDDEEEESAKRSRPKLKLTARRPSKTEAKAGNAKDKGKQKAKAGDPSTKTATKETPLESSPEASKKPDKGKKPKAAEADAESSKLFAPPAPPQILPGSYLAEVPVDQLPEKRKGPGRPPKNGLVSKRDEQLVQRKRKEYEKRGEEVPAFDALVAMVRKETKAKEAAQKLANGTLPTGSVVQSIETDSTILPRPSTGPAVQPAGQSSSVPAEAARKPSPKPKRTAKSPSPVAPKESYSEEDLKKPTKTYYYIINDLLESHAEHQADLQELYHLIMKKYPYFKYGVEGTGWQSSVRHNLLQHKRFVEVGKSGKGKFWAIDPAEPLEKEKKRRITPPPRPPGQPYMQQHGIGMATYGNPYAQNGAGQGQFPAGQQPGPNGNYYSPYNQGYNGQAQQGQGITYPRPSQQRGPHALQHQARPPQPPPNPYQALVDNIMEYRQTFLRPFMADGIITQGKSDVFSEVLNYLSDAHQKDWRKATMREDYTDEQKTIYKALYEKFDKEYVKVSKEKEQQAQRQQQQGTHGQTQPTNQAPQSSNQIGAYPGGATVANGVNAAAYPQQSQLPPATPVAAPPTQAAQPVERPEPSPISAPASQAQSPAPSVAGMKRAAEADGGADADAKRIKSE